MSFSGAKKKPLSKIALNAVLKKLRFNCPRKWSQEEATSLCLCKLFPGKYLSRQDKDASAARLEQARQVIFKWRDALLSPLAKFYSAKAKVASRLEKLIDKIENAFKTILTEEKGWSYQKEPLGASLYPGWTSLSFRKSGWREEYEVELITDSLFSNDMNIGITQADNKKENNPRLVAFYNAWRKALIDIPGMDEENMIGRNEDFCAWALFPEGLSDWTENELYDEDFSFALNEEQEKELVAFCRKCAEAIAANEGALDALAKSE